MGGLLILGLVVVAGFQAARGPSQATPSVPPAPVAAQAAPLIETANAPEPSTYEVQAGDGWWKIAKANGVDFHALLDANGATAETALYPGERLVIPTGAAQTSTPPDQAGAAARTPPMSIPVAAQPVPGSGYQGNGYGEISNQTGLPRTNYVHGYTKKNGTVVNGYYRSHK